jgi:hypothetical protein
MIHEFSSPRIAAANPAACCDRTVVSSKNANAWKEPGTYTSDTIGLALLPVH